GGRGAEICRHGEAVRSPGEGSAHGNPATRAEVTYAIEGENASTLADVLLRRTCLGLARDRAVSLALPVADVAGFSPADVEHYADTVSVEQVAPVGALA